MIVDNSSEKLKNAIIFFVRNTKHCGKTKLYKLLYFLDFEHYRDIGRNVTGLDYYAWPMGPVPKQLHEYLDEPEKHVGDFIQVAARRIGNDRSFIEITPKVEFDHRFFTIREMKLLGDLSKEYYSARAEDMVEATHLENMPWHSVYEKEGRRQALIPYEYALRKGELEIMGELKNEHEEFRENYR